jgi:hypothetical protein
MGIMMNMNYDEDESHDEYEDESESFYDDYADESVTSPEM